jgi:hypothetical protein
MEPTDSLRYDETLDDFSQLHSIRQNNPKSEPSDIESVGLAPAADDDGFYLVKDIEARRFCSGRWEFFCSFQGYPRSENMWLPYSSLNAWCQEYADKLFNLDDNDRMIPVPNAEQQHAVDEALRATRLISYNKQLLTHCSDCSDSDSDDFDPDYTVATPKRRKRISVPTTAKKNNNRNIKSKQNQRRRNKKTAELRENKRQRQANNSKPH